MLMVSFLKKVASRVRNMCGARFVYADYASLTPVDPRVMREVALYSGIEYANPSSIHAGGVRAHQAVLRAKEACAGCIGAHADEIIFTGSGTESNNIAIQGVVEQLARTTPYKDLHIITSRIEHTSVLEVFAEYERRGVCVDYIDVDERGLIRLEDLEKKITPSTRLISIMLVNNEIGTIQPLHEIARIVRHARKKFGQHIFLHTDASQAPLYIDIRVDKLGVDLLTLDGHKVYGPRGIGLLYIRRGTVLKPIMFGGGQESGLRPATPNVPAIMGLARALILDDEERSTETLRITGLRDYLIDKLHALHPSIKLTGDPVERIANNIHITIEGVDTEFLSLQLDAHGIACSTKSSCLRDSDESYVLSALGLARMSTHALRITLGRYTSKADILYIVRVLEKLL